MNRMRMKMPTPSAALRVYELRFSNRLFQDNRGGDGWNVLVGRVLAVRNATQR